MDSRCCLGSVLCWFRLGNLAFKASLGWDLGLCRKGLEAG